MKIEVGTKIGRKTITKVFKIGPFTHVETVCDCSFGTKGTVSLGMLLSGRSLTCRGCKRELIEEAGLKYLNMVHKLQLELKAQLALDKAPRKD